MTLPGDLIARLTATRQGTDADVAALSRAVHSFAETAWQEHRSAAAVRDRLQAWGFDVDRAAHGLDTAVSARAGQGPLVVTLCAEYDALPGMGHACGHNLIAAVACQAAAILTGVADDLGITVHVLGTPAEERDGGKILQLERGAFDATHLALMAHPAPVAAAAPAFLATVGLAVTWTGRESHASLAPDRGRNAADALTLAQVGIGLLRQHLPPGDQVHGIVTHGGDAPNIVPGRAQGEWILRSRTGAGLEAVRARVQDCFAAGALATGCTVDVVAEAAYLDVVTDPDLARLWSEAAAAVGRPVGPPPPGGASDMGNVSHVIPSLHALFALDAGGAVNHQPEFAAAAVTDDAHRAAGDAALTLAMTVAAAATDPGVRRRLLDRGAGPSTVRPGSRAQGAER